jgi:hypothetical protein
MQQLTREGGGGGADSLLFFHDYKDTLNLKTNLLLCVIFQQALVLCMVKMCTFAVRHICFKPVVSFLIRYNGYYHKVLCCRPTYQLIYSTRTFMEVIKLKEIIF